MKPLFNVVSVPIYYFKKHFKPCFLILDILQHFKFVNWRIRFLMSWPGYLPFGNLMVKLLSVEQTAAKFCSQKQLDFPQLEYQIYPFIGDFWQSLYSDKYLWYLVGPATMLSIIVLIPAYLGTLFFINGRHIKYVF